MRIIKKEYFVLFIYFLLKAKFIFSAVKQKGENFARRGDFTLFKQSLKSLDIIFLLLI